MTIKTFILSLFILMLLPTSSFGQSESSIFVSFTTEDIVEIVIAGETNQFRFKKKYKGKLLDATVEFLKITEGLFDIPGWVVHTKSVGYTKEGKQIENRVICGITDEVAEKAIDFEPGFEISIKGKIRDVSTFIGNSLLLDSDGCDVDREWFKKKAN